MVKRALLAENELPKLLIDYLIRKFSYFNDQGNLIDKDFMKKEIRLFSVM